MKQIFQDLLVLILLILLVVFLWFSKGLIFAGGEEGIPFYDLNKTLQFLSFTWQDISAGYSTQLNLNRIPYFTFLKMFYSFGMPGYLIQAMHFLIIMSVGTLSLYFLLRETLSKELETKDNSLLKLVPLIGAVFYLLNPFSMTQIWGRGIYLQFFPFALFPFMLLMFVLGLQSKNFIYGILGLLASVFFAGSYGNPSYIFSQWIILFIYLVFYIFKNLNKKEILSSIFYFALMIIGWVMVQMFWIYPFLKTSSNQFAQALNNTQENLGTLRGISKDYQLPSLIRLIHEGYFYRDQKYGNSYLTPPFLLISWLIPLIAIFSCSFFKKLKIFLFFCILFLFSLFICLGANKPLGWLMVLIFEIFPPFQTFRNPFEKFGLVLTIAYAPFFAIGTIVVSQKLSHFFKKINSQIFVLGILLLVCGIFLWPIWTGQFSGGVKISPWVKVPHYYRVADDWLNKQEDDGRIIHFPINPGDGLRYGGWEYPYQGIEPSEYIFTRSAIGKNGQPFKDYYNVLLQRFDKFKPLAYGPDPDISESEFKSDETFEELAKLNARYIILHKDINPDVGEIGSWEKVEAFLSTQPNIKKVQTFDLLDVYKVNFDQEIQLIYSPQVKVSYSKINPTLYTVTISNVQGPFQLYFLENFDSNWEAYIDGQKIDNHNRVFAYANKWNIENFGNSDVVLKYKGQDFVDQGMRVTKTSVSILSLMIAAYFFWKIWRIKRI